MKNNAETALYACMVPSYDAIQPWIHFAWKKKVNIEVVSLISFKIEFFATPLILM